MATSRANNPPRVNLLLGGCQAVVLASLLLTQLATAAGTSWNPPLRIAIQAQAQGSRLLQSKNRGPRRFRSNAKPSRSNEEAEQRPAATDIESALYDEDEWKALFQQEGQDSSSPATYPASRSIAGVPPRKNGHEETRGFRHTLSLPAFLQAPRQTDEEISYDDYEEAKVIPCAAVVVSSKARGKRSLKSLNQRKDAQFLQSTSATAAAAAATIHTKGRPLVLWENMVCGAISRSIAQTMMHPANTMKTMLQQSNAPPMASFLTPDKFPTLFRGAGANFILSVPHGAINFAVLEMVRKELSRGVRASAYWREREDRIGAPLDFLSSAISTICCSVVSTPQMMITDNIMAGNYNNLPAAVRGLASQGKGIQGFYARGWWPGLVGKIPSYALTWTFFQELKAAQQRFSGREATNLENSIMGCLASATTVCIMIPMDTIKTRLVTQASSAAVLGGAVPYKGIVDCAVRVAREEGIKTFYRGLPPRLVSVVPMIGIQFTVYEFMKRAMQKRALGAKMAQQQQQPDPYSSLGVLQEASMEVAASPEHPYPAPRIMRKKNKSKGTETKR